MSRLVANRVMYLLIGLAAGVLLEARVFSPLRAQRSSVLAEIRGELQSGPHRVVEGGVTHDFGEFEPDVNRTTSVQHTFAIHNDGNAPLVIKQVKPSCGCTTASFDRDTILAGETARLDIAVDLRNRFGPQNQMVLIRSNDPARPDVTVSLVGNSVTRIKKTPSILNLGRVAPEAEASGNVEVAATDGVTLEISGLRSGRPGVTGLFREIEPGKRFQVTMTLAPGQPPGEYRGSVRLLTNHESYPEIILPLRAYIGPGGPVLVGDQPALSGPALDGHTIDWAEFRGKPSVVVFWASWCGYCKREIPRLRQLYQKYHDRGLNVIGVNVDAETEKAIAGCRDLKIPWRNIHFASGGSETGLKNPLSTQFGVHGIPAMYLLDSSGTVLVANAHSLSFEDRITELLN